MTAANLCQCSSFSLWPVISGSLFPPRGHTVTVQLTQRCAICAFHSKHPTASLRRAPISKISKIFNQRPIVDKCPISAEIVDRGNRQVAAVGMWVKSGLRLGQIISWLSITWFHWLSVDRVVDWSFHLRPSWLLRIEKFNELLVES